MKISYGLGLLIPEVIARSRFRDGEKRLGNADVLMANYTSPVHLCWIEMRRCVMVQLLQLSRVYSKFSIFKHK